MNKKDLTREQLEKASGQVLDICAKLKAAFPTKTPIEGTILVCAMIKIIKDSVENDISPDLNEAFENMLISLTCTIAEYNIKQIVESN